MFPECTCFEFGKKNNLKSAYFPCLFIVKYFDFSASADGFDLSLFNMHTISDTSVMFCCICFWMRHI